MGLGVVANLDQLQSHYRTYWCGPWLHIYQRGFEMTVRNAKRGTAESLQAMFWSFLAIALFVAISMAPWLFDEAEMGR